MSCKFKALVFVKKDDLPMYVSRVRIHDVLDIEAKIIESIPDDSYVVTFHSYGGYKCFETSDDPCSRYTKYGFKYYHEAERYANEEIHKILDKFVSSVMRDINMYIIEGGH